MTFFIDVPRVFGEGYDDPVTITTSRAMAIALLDSLSAGIVYENGTATEEQQEIIEKGSSEIVNSLE